MCSTGVLCEMCPETFIRSSSICSGVFEMRRNRSVSVTIFNGIRLRMSSFNGRMSCVDARRSSMTNMFSALRISTAGSDDGIFTGMVLQGLLS